MPILLAIALAAACAEDEGTTGGTGSGQTPIPFPVPSPFPGIASEVVVPEAKLPGSLAFAPDGRLFYAERATGDVRIVTPDGQLLGDPFVHVDLTFYEGTSWGLVGLALDPQFDSNHYVYVYFTQPVGQTGAKPVLMRFTDVDNLGVDPKVIVDDLPEATLYGEYYVGGSISFGPDGYLYVPIGDFDETDHARDLSSVRGKILRLNKEDGSPAPDNPFIGQADADPRVFAYGLLWPYDITFHPLSRQLYATERGFYFCCDELNLIAGGLDYGWRQGGPTADAAPPIYQFALPGQTPEGSKVYPAGIEFASAAAYPTLGDSLLVCESTTAYIRRLALVSDGIAVQGDDIIAADCKLDIAISPDGTVYYSNQTEIRRLVASPESP